MSLASQVSLAITAIGTALKGKQPVAQVVSVINTTSWTIAVAGAANVYAQNTGLTGALTINNPTGTLTEGQLVWISVTGTASRAINYGTAFEDSTQTRPTTTNGTARLDMLFVYNSATSKLRFLTVV